ncbi:outer membrane protein assembly factor BamE [Pseudooceanicola algae]|uniref:Outer membrane protein assembly factor BamE domain-containing protein n=1 Tax=Pseudooceanicola algae TaxID=1537215 RepID=A0A418SDP6_9RHOB|nr:outer membrane protein assembly factor BamE [Pseudooceanicola algae]QPM89466.1 hypothetical protein PSAL_006860 [Pseudooceanicola algae]
MGRKRIRAGHLVACVALIGLSACVARYRNHGYIPDEATLSQVTVGVDTRETVEAVVGSPTTSGVENNGDFYYVRSRVREYGPNRPEIITREVLALSFNEAGILSNVESYGLEDGNLVVLTRRVTDSSTGDNTFIRQLLGNLGQIDPSSVIGTE